MSGSAQTSAHSVPAAASRLDSALCPASAHSAQEKRATSAMAVTLTTGTNSVSRQIRERQRPLAEVKEVGERGQQHRAADEHRREQQKKRERFVALLEKRRHGAHAQAQRRKLDEQLHLKTRTGS